MTVTGIPIDAIDFYEDLGADNSRTWWQANKDRYAASVRTPLTSLLEELADEFGTPHLFRPHRDVRFSPDKRPYKDHQGALCLTAPGMGYYVQLSADGLRIGGGYYPTGKDQLVRQRAAIDAPETGLALAAIADALVAQGFELGADPVATRPRGVPADHRRLELLRYRTVRCPGAGGRVGQGDAAASPLRTRVRGMAGDCAARRDRLVLRGHVARARPWGRAGRVGASREPGDDTACASRIPVRS